MIKRILVATDGSLAAQHGVDYALDLAKQLEAHVTALYVVDIKLLEGPFLRDLSASMGTAPFVNYQASIAEIFEERGKNALTAVEAQASAAGVSLETELRTGVIHHTILERAELADLLVLGHGGEHVDWLEGLMGSTTEAVIRRATLPVVVVPELKPMSAGLLAAFDGSANASSALKIAANIATNYKIPLKVLVAGDDESDTAVSKAQAYLSDHGLDAPIERRDGDAGPVIVQCASETAPGLLVIGAYGHSRFHELLLGSTTTYVVNHAKCPILLCR
ncbi:MAG: hypothetical protein GC168_17915 [Candidatus Hydrogenedens sp.]|nr:hypothetical protein [Candidatus Hydrogenedens sp.]